MAAPNLLAIAISAAGVVAAPTLPIPAGGAVLVGMRAGLFTPLRVLVVPAGTTPLPRGVHAVAVAVPAPAAAGSGCRGAMRWAVAAVAAPAGGSGSDDDDDDDDAKLQDAFYTDLEMYGADALEMLTCIEPPEHLIGMADLTKDALEKAVRKAKAKEDKMECIKELLYGIEGVVKLGKDCAPKETPGIVYLNYEEWIGDRDVAASVEDGADDASMMNSVTRAMLIAKETLLRCIGHTAAGADKLLRFEDPEDW